MWQKGQSGNPTGKSRQKRFLETLDRAILQDEGKSLRAAADKLLACAQAGEPWAIQMLADRLDGKPHQSVDLDASVALRKASDLSDDELAAVAHGAGAAST